MDGFHRNNYEGYLKVKIENVLSLHEKGVDVTTGGSPSLEELWDGDKDLKWRTFLDVVHPSLWETKIRTLPPHLVVPVAILFYLQVGYLNFYHSENIQCSKNMGLFIFYPLHS